MILFIANHAFPDHSGFSNRCRNAIQALRKLDKVVIVCQQKSKSSMKSKETTYYEDIPVYRYGIGHQSIERTNKAKYISGWYETKRNFDLFWNMITTLSHVITKYKSKEKIKAYVVVSPLTTPLYVYFISLFLPIELSYVEFHDLEPETAMHLKGLKQNSLVMKVEYFLEKFICRKYKKIVVTNSVQKDRIMQRTGAANDNVFILPNILETHKEIKNSSRKMLSLSKKDFIVAYSSSLSYDYTTNGVVYIIENLESILKKIPYFKLVVIGGGDGLEVLQTAIQKNKVKNTVITTGKIPNVQDYLAISDVAIIPWTKDVMTETILPTKLFEYMVAKKAIVAPDFGEFKLVINGKNGLLFKDNQDMIHLLSKLYTNPSLKGELGHNAYTYYMQEYNPSKLLQKFRSFLQEP